MATPKCSDVTAMFKDCYKLETIDLSTFDTSGVTTFKQMFQNCYALTSIESDGSTDSDSTLDVSALNVNKAGSFESMFDGCESLVVLDLYKWNLRSTGGIKSDNMFNNCQALETILVSTGWNQARFTANSTMFNNCLAIRGASGATYTDMPVANATDHGSSNFAHVGLQPGERVGRHKHRGPEAGSRTTT